jgi:nicotinamide phosphoribosyltransferase
MKASAALINGTWVDVYKDPITDQGKRSKRGRLKLIKNVDGYTTVTNHDNMFDALQDELVTVFENGTLVTEYTFDEVRARAQIR